MQTHSSQAKCSSICDPSGLFIQKTDTHSLQDTCSPRCDPSDHFIQDTDKHSSQVTCSTRCDPSVSSSFSTKGDHGLHMETDDKNVPILEDDNTVPNTALTIENDDTVPNTAVVTKEKDNITNNQNNVCVLTLNVHNALNITSQCVNIVEKDDMVEKDASLHLDDIDFVSGTRGLGIVQNSSTSSFMRSPDISSSTTIVSAKKNINSDHINLNTDLAGRASADNCEKIMYSAKAIKIGQTYLTKADINVKQHD